eukprot:TRINITY_DN19245_c0_g1_i1.p1 TRINITY_DN19245_c0_g1~~TRINITY_DN19245_c0_g1_i1.p1  ORF type:complete len:493 (-),score=135.20 TRINITY_DN19245_c0_g1_i1:53-1531(-)
MHAKIALILLLAAASAVYAQTANGNITYTIAATTVSFQCSNGAWTDFGLSMTVNVYVNNSGPHSPMAETGLPTIKLSWFVDGAAATATLTSAFNVANVASSGNVVSFDLMDDQPSIGGTFAVGTCTSGQTQPTITVAMSSSTFIVGQGFTNPTIPAVNGIPSIVNQFPAANNAGGSTGTSASSGTTMTPTTAAPTVAPTVAATTAPTVAPTKAPTVVVTVAPTAAPTTAGAVPGNITYTVTPANVAFQCSNGAWTDFGLSLTVQVIVNGLTPMQPMAETGLPTLDFAWFVSGAAATATLTNSFNVANPTSNGNVVSFTLMDDQPNVGGTFAVGTCTQGQTQPPITVKISSTSFIVGQGLANPVVPAVSGVPTIVNNFPAANNAGGSVGSAAAAAPTAAPTTTTGTIPHTAAPTVAGVTQSPTAVAPGQVAATTTGGTSTQSSSVGIGVGVVAAVVVIGGAFFGVRRYRKQRGEAFLPGPKSPANNDQFMTLN